MKRQLLFIIIFINCFTCFGQQLYLEFGSTISSFDYKDSQRESLENLLSKPHNYLAMGYRDVINKNETLFLSIGVLYNGYGAIGSNIQLDNYYEWDTTYIGLNSGLDIKLFQLRDFSFYLKGSFATEFLIRGTQTINNRVYNLVGKEQFNSIIFFARSSLGMQHSITRSTLIYVNYTYGKTILLNKTSNTEKLKLNTHQIGIGFIINLPNCNCRF